MSEVARAGALTDTEREVSQRLSQGFAWPTVLLLVALIAIEIAVIAAWAGGVMPLLLGMFINSLAGYGCTPWSTTRCTSVSNRDPKYRVIRGCESGPAERSVWRSGANWLGGDLGSHSWQGLATGCSK
jgi:hypothetical protein